MAAIFIVLSSQPSPTTARRSHWICIGGTRSPLATVWRAGRECGSGNISTQYLLRVGRSARSLIHTVILTMSSGVPPAAPISRRTFANIAAHCASRSSGTLPVAESAPEIAPETTNGPLRLAAGIGLRCLTPETSMLRLLSMFRLLRLGGKRDDREPAAARQQTAHYSTVISPVIPVQSWSG